MFFQSLHLLGRSFGEWGGHQELYAASQSLHVNIIVHQCSRTAPRFILPCETATRSINLSYHGECHYNSVHPLVNKLVSQEFCDIKKSISCIITSTTNKPNFAQVEAVLRALPWTSSTTQVEQALKLSRNNVDAAVELLMLNPDGLDDDVEDRGAINYCSGAGDENDISKSTSPSPHVSFDNYCTRDDGKNSFSHKPSNHCEQVLQTAPKIKIPPTVGTKLSRKV